MTYLGSWKIDDTLTFTANTHDPSNGMATDADAVPYYQVYEDETGTPLVTGTMATLNAANTLGFYSEQIALSAANGFEKGKSYNIYMGAVVDGVTGTTSRFFQLEAEVDANSVSDQTLADIYSDTTIIASDVVQIYSDTTVIASDTAAIETDTGNIYSDTAIIYSDTTAIHSETTVIQSDTTAIEIDTGNIYSDTTIIASDVLLVYSDTAAVAWIFSDTTKIESDTAVIEASVAQIYSDTTIIASDAVQIYSDTTLLETNVTTIINRVGAFTGSGVNTVLGFLQALGRSDASDPSDMGGTYAASADSQQAIRDRGDSAWTTGAGGTPPDLLQNTTIATLASQTSFTLTAGSADDDAYNGATIVVTDSVTSEQKAVGRISDYAGGTKTVTLAADPGIFVMAVGDTVDVVATSTHLAQIYSDTTVVVSDTTQIVSDVAQVYSDTALIYSDTTAIHSETTAIQTDTGNIYSDTTIIASDAVQIYSDTAAIHSETTAIQTSATAIYSDTTIIASDVVQVYSDTTALGTNVTTIINRVGAFTGSGVNTVLGFLQALGRSDASDPSDMGGSYAATTDSQQAIRDRGDSAWTGGGGGSSSDLLQNTTIATLASQTSFTLTDGSTDDDAYNGATIIITDQSTSTQKAVARISDYVGSTKTVTLAVDPGIFVMAIGDTVDVMATSPHLAQIYSDTTVVASDVVQIYSDTTIIVSDTTQIVSDIALLNDISVSDILTTQMTESYAADGTAPTLAQALMLIQQSIGDFSIAGTTLTVKELDGSTTAATYTLDDATDPTSRTRAT